MASRLPSRLSRRRFIKAASGLLVPASLARGSVPLPLGFFTVASSGSSYSTVPTSVGTCVGWWRSDVFTGLSDGAAIGGTTVWSNSSGTSNDLTQSTSGSRPVYKTNIFGSLPSVRFDGSDDFLVPASTFDFGSSSTFTIVFVATANSAGDLLAGGNSSELRYPWIGSSAILIETAAGGDSFTMATNASTVKMMSYRSSSGVGNGIWRENKTDDGVHGSGLAFAISRIGANTDGSQPFNGDVGELIIYSNKLATTDLDTLYDNYMKAKYSLP